MSSFEARLAIFFAGLTVSVGWRDAAREDAGELLCSSLRLVLRIGVYGGVSGTRDVRGLIGTPVVEGNVSMTSVMVANDDE
jgi:hypothetical protein